MQYKNEANSPYSKTEYRNHLFEENVKSATITKKKMMTNKIGRNEKFISKFFNRYRGEGHPKHFACHTAKLHRSTSLSFRCRVNAAKRKKKKGGRTEKGRNP